MRISDMTPKGFALLELMTIVLILGAFLGHWLQLLFKRLAKERKLLTLVSAQTMWT